MELPILTNQEYEYRMDKISLNGGILKIDNRKKIFLMLLLYFIS